MPALEQLIANNYNVAGALTRPDEPAGRKQALTPPPVKVFARQHNIPVLQPERLEQAQLISQIPRSDLFVVSAYGKVIPPEILALPKYGAINIHPSLLPRWRGPSPIQAAILAGDKEAGVSLIRIDEFLDHGPIIAQKKIPLPEHIIYPQLHDTLAKIGAALLIESLPRYLTGQIVPIAQNDAAASFSPLLKKDSGRIDWSRPGVEIERMVRAFTPWPGTWTLWPSARQIYRILVQDVEVLPDEPPHGSPGFVWQDDQNPVLVKTGKGSLAIRKLVIAGKKTTDAPSLIRGYPDVLGATFI
ncbi:MAG: methionyl-tRNA formyltransferase [Candidatus Sungbacteria bacterium]|nr:methionyl-tRNA formyltransferase [Candidatus Sungbacteria bacterium]